MKDKICMCSCHQYGITKCDCNGLCCIRSYKKYINKDGKLDRSNWNNLRATEKLFSKWEE
jgi:hypothetical protein